MLLSGRMLIGAWICSFMKQITERSKMMGRIRLTQIGSVKNFSQIGMQALA